MQTWQMQEAKARLSEVVKRAELEGPQDITLLVNGAKLGRRREEKPRLLQLRTELREVQRWRM